MCFWAHSHRLPSTAAQSRRRGWMGSSTALARPQTAATTSASPGHGFGRVPAIHQGGCLALASGSWHLQYSLHSAFMQTGPSHRMSKTYTWRVHWTVARRLLQGPLPSLDSWPRSRHPGLPARPAVLYVFGSNKKGRKPAAAETPRSSQRTLAPQTLCGGADGLSLPRRRIGSCWGWGVTPASATHLGASARLGIFQVHATCHLYPLLPRRFSCITVGGIPFVFSQPGGWRCFVSDWLSGGSSQKPLTPLHTAPGKCQGPGFSQYLCFLGVWHSRLYWGQRCRVKFLDHRRTHAFSPEALVKRLL